MTTSDPQQILDQITARADAATEGPWELNTSPRILGAWLIPRVSPVLRAHRADAEFIVHSRTDNDRMRGALAEVLALHYARWAPFPFPGGFICDACREPVESEPCTTVRAIEAKLNQEDQG